MPELVRDLLLFVFVASTLPFAGAFFIQYVNVGKILDEKLLFAAEKFVKVFNWITGKDNFWIARATMVLTSLSYIVGLLMLDEIFVVINSAIYNSLFIISTWWNINIVELDADKAAKEGIKRIESLSDNAFMRGASISILLLFGVLYFGTQRAVVDIFVMTIGFVVVCYLISCDKPPFSRSMVKGWPNNFLRSFALLSVRSIKSPA